ncbi:MAG: HD domain-containing phosphohydrolase [Geobacteraceae bacterium]
MTDTIQVLCVDDEENILKALRRLLANEDMDVLIATSGEQGLEILRSTEGISVIVSDQRMPGLCGTAFLQQVREIAPDIPRIMLTGYADISATIDAINKGGCYRYISKPWNDEGLIRTIKEAAGFYQVILENRSLTEIVQKQNKELQEWNTNLKSRVLEQTSAIRTKISELHLLNDKLKQNYEGSLLAFSGLMELRDRQSRNHCRNVAEVAVQVAKKCGSESADLEQLRVAALLHDIGKIGMSDNLLQGDMDAFRPHEIQEYRLHPVRGQAAIDAVEDLRPAGILIRHHHENFDGSGFPDQLSGKDIPLGARIIAMADAADRTFFGIQGNNAIEVTLQEISSLLGTRLDPTLFPHVASVVKEKYREFSKVDGMVEEELYPGELRRGMQVTHAVRSGTGLLLLGEGEVLDEWNITSLKRYYQLDPPDRGIRVLIKQ